MKPFKTLVTASIVALSVASTLAHSQPPSKEEQAMGFRQGVFQGLSWKMGQLAGAKGAGDRAAFQKHANDLAYLTGLITEGFIPDSLIEGSAAKPAVWGDAAGFQAAAEKMQSMAAELASDDYDMGSFDPRGFGREGCGGCHKDFKERN